MRESEFNLQFYGILLFQPLFSKEFLFCFFRLENRKICTILNEKQVEAELSISWERKIETT